MSFIYAFTDTRWSAAGTTYNGIWLDVSNGSSGSAVGAAASRLFKLTNNGSTLFAIDLNGSVAINSNTTNQGILWGHTATNRNLLVRDSSGATQLCVVTDNASAYAPFNIDGSPLKLNGMVYAPGFMELPSTTVDFSVAGDNSITVNLPTGFTRFLVNSVRLSGASASLVLATAGLFTAAAGAGVAVVTGASAITVATASEDTNLNAQAFTVNNGSSQSYKLTDVPTLFFRVGSTTPGTGNVLVTIIPLA